MDPLALNEHERQELGNMLNSDVFKKAEMIVELNEPTVFPNGSISAEAKVNIFHEIRGYRARGIVLKNLLTPPQPKKVSSDPEVNYQKPEDQFELSEEE